MFYLKGQYVKINPDYPYNSWVHNRIGKIHSVTPSDPEWLYTVKFSGNYEFGTTDNVLPLQNNKYISVIDCQKCEENPATQEADQYFQVEYWCDDCVERSADKEPNYDAETSQEKYERDWQEHVRLHS